MSDTWPSTAVADQVVASVAGVPLRLSEVEARVRSLRAGRMAAVLPAGSTAEGRNMRRWVVQLCAAERLVRTALAAAGRPEHPAGPAEGPAGSSPPRLTVDAALRVGGVAAAVLHAWPGAWELVPLIAPSEAECRDYYERNQDLFPAGFEAARAGIAAELAEQAGVTDFGRWLDRQLAEEVQLAPGFEHPAEPGHPDSTHRH